VTAPGPSRTEANAALREHALPRLRAAGFAGALPHLRRARAERVELVTFQFDRWGGAFCVELAICAPGGIVTPWGKLIPADKASAINVNPGQGRWRLRVREGDDDCWFRYDNLRSAGPGEFCGTARACAEAAAAAILTRGETYFQRARPWWPGA